MSHFPVNIYIVLFLPLAADLSSYYLILKKSVRAISRLSWLKLMERAKKKKVFF